MTFAAQQERLAAVGERVKARRCELGLTQLDLARKAGVSRTVVTNVEAARQGLSQQTLTGFAKVLGLSYAELMPDDSGHEADHETPPIPEPAPFPDREDRRHAPGGYLMVMARCHECGTPIERDGSYVKEGWRYWCVSCFKARA